MKMKNWMMMILFVGGMSQAAEIDCIARYTIRSVNPAVNHLEDVMVIQLHQALNDLTYYGSARTQMIGYAASYDSRFDLGNNLLNLENRTANQIVLKNQNNSLVFAKNEDRWILSGTILMKEKVAPYRQASFVIDRAICIVNE